MTGQADISLLGGFAVAIDGRSVGIASAKTRALLARLALDAGSTVSAGQLIEAIWPEVDRPADPARALRYRVWELRNLLEPDRADRSEGTLVLTGSVGYLLAIHPSAVDALRVEAEWDRIRAGGGDPGTRRHELGALLDAWRPAVFAGRVDGPLVEAAARLDRLRVTVLVERITADLAFGLGAELIAELETLIAAQPFDEHLRGQLMVALYRSGRQAEALAVHTATRALLVEELGVEPGPELRDLQRRILDHSPDLGAPVPAASPQPPHAARAQRLIGRHAELARLTQALAEVTSHAELRTAVVAGDAGIGKSSLLKAFAGSVAPPVLVLQGRCDEAVSVPLQPFRAIADRLVANADDELLAAHTAVHGRIMAVLTPAFAHRVGRHVPLGADSETDRFLLFEAMADLVSRVAARRPLVLLLDDLHWAEPTALQLLRHLMRTVVDDRVLVVASTRSLDDAVSPELRSALADVARSSPLRIDLGGLGRAPLEELVRAMSGDGTVTDIHPDVVATLDADSAGNPLFATHLVQHWIDTGRMDVSTATIRFASPSGAMVPLPPTLRDIVWTRLRALGPDAPTVLAAATVLGDDISESSLIELLDVGPDVVASVLDTAARAGIVQESQSRAGTVRFTHALIAQAVDADLPATRRRRLHERAARSLEQTGGRSVAHLTRIASHWDRAASPIDALRSALDAGDAALRSLASDEAVHWYRRALDHAEAVGAGDAERSAVLVRLGRGLQRVGDAAALDTLVRGAELARRCGDHDTLVHAALATGRGTMRFGDFAHTHRELVEQALAVVPGTDVDTRARLLAMLGTSLMGSADAGRREGAANEALALADASADPHLIARLAPDILSALWTPITAEMRVDISDRAVVAARASGDPYLQFMVGLSAYHTAVSLGDAGRASVSLAALHAAVEGHTEPRMQWSLSVILTFVATMAARFDEAERLAHVSVEQGVALGEPDAFSVFASQMYVNGTFAGRYGEMLPLIDQVLASGETAMVFRLAHAIACAVSGRREEASAVLAAGAADGFASVPQDLAWLTSIVGYAVLAIELGDRAAAAELSVLLQPYAAQVAFNGATSQGPVAAYLGRLAVLLGRYDDADRHLRGALATTEAFGWEYHRASTLVCLAESRIGRTGVIDGDAGHLLNEAERSCVAHGIGWWHDRIRSLRAATV